MRKRSITRSDSRGAGTRKAGRAAQHSAAVIRHPTQPRGGPAPSFAALADPTRRAVLDLLRRGNLSAGDIAAKFPVSRPAISQHLRVLRRACLVREDREGRRRVYRLDPGPLRAVDAWLGHYRKFWNANLSGLKHYLESEAVGARPKEISSWQRQMHLPRRTPSSAKSRSRRRPSASSKR